MRLRIAHKKKSGLLFAVLVVIAIFTLLLFSVPKKTKKENYNADLVIENARIITLNEKSELINRGWIAIKDGRIIGLGSGKYDYISKETINAANKTAMPGFVNTHTHIAMTLMRGIDDNSRLDGWLSNIGRYEGKITKEDAYWGSLLGEIEMIKSGTTTFNDMYFFEESTVSSVKKIGIRAIIDIPYNLKDDEAEIDQEFIKRNKSFSRITLSITPNPLINFPLKKLQSINSAATENNIPIHLHIEENQSDKEVFTQRYNATPLQMLADSGLLDRKIIMAHASNLTESEIKTLSNYPAAGISLNPKSNFKLSGSTASIKKMIDYGLELSIGTDGAGSSNSLDMFDHMNFLVFILKECGNEKTACQEKNDTSAEKIIRMATIEGAKVLGLKNDIGSIEVGKKADIILLDLQKAGLTPSYDIYSTLVYSADGSDVTDSVIDGNVVMRDGVLTQVDEKEAIEKVNEIAERIKTVN